MKPVLAARELEVSRGDRDVLRALSITFHPGQWTALVGTNGAGKSTLLAALAGLMPPKRGSVWLGDRLLDDWADRDRARQLAWMSQQGQADGELSAIDVVRLGRVPHTGLWGQLTQHDELRVASAMRDVDCQALATRRLSALSGGERQRVLLARLLATDAPVMLLDEPTTHLDAPHQRALLQSLRGRAAQGACIVTALHDLSQALSADRLLLLADGRITADGAPGDEHVHLALQRAFDDALRIAPVDIAGRRHWVAVPL